MSVAIRVAAACGVALCVTCAAALAAETAAPPFRVLHLKVKGESLPWAVWLPPGYEPTRAWPCGSSRAR